MAASTSPTPPARGARHPVPPPLPANWQEPRVTPSRGWYAVPVGLLCLLPVLLMYGYVLAMGQNHRYREPPGSAAATRDDSGLIHGVAVALVAVSATAVGLAVLPAVLRGRSRRRVPPPWARR